MRKFDYAGVESSTKEAPMAAKPVAKKKKYSCWDTSSSDDERDRLAKKNKRPSGMEQETEKLNMAKT